MQILQAGNRDAAVIVPTKPCGVINAHIDELSQHRKPVFTWCQPLQAKLRFHPTVEEVLRGPQESMIYYGLLESTDAKKLASRTLNEKVISSMLWDGYGAICKESDYGRKAFYEVRKLVTFLRLQQNTGKTSRKSSSVWGFVWKKLKTIFTDTNLPMYPNEVWREW